MKILKIAFQNINSLKGMHEIDFSKPPFTTGFLFAITGPTGSGKSTLLDVISLGLFSQVPRLGKITKNDVQNKGAILTRNQKEAFAKVTYSCKSGVYESLWRISTNSRGNLRDYEMQLLNVATGEVLDLKKREVPGKNEELIGLNYSQFIKSVLLAQGEFAQFLKARKEDRAELLEKITGTGIYRRLGQLAYEKHKEVTASIEKQQQELDILLEKAIGNEEILEYQKELSEKTSLCTQVEGKVETLKKELELKKEIAQRSQQIQALENSLKKAGTAVLQFEEAHGKPLKAHEKVRHCAEELREWSQSRNHIQELRQQVQQKKTTEKEQQDQLSACLEQTSTFTGSRIDSENLSESLKSFAEKVSKLQQDQENKRTAFVHLRQQLSPYLANLSIKFDAGAPQESLEKLLELKNLSQQELLIHQHEFGSLNIDQIKPRELELRDLLKKGHNAREQQRELGRLDQELKNLGKEAEDLGVKINLLPPKIADLGKQQEAVQRELEILILKRDNELLHARVEDLRGQLRTGDPCPLCGAKDHPYAAEAPDKKEGFEIQVEQKEKELRSLQHQLSSQTATLKTLTGQLEKLEQTARGRSQYLKEREKLFNSQFGSLQQEKEIMDWELWCDQLEKQLLDLEIYEKELKRQDNLQKALPIHQELNEVLEEGKLLKTALSKIYIGKDIHGDCSKLKDNWMQISNNLTSLQQQQKELELTISRRKKALLSLEERLSLALSSTEFPDITAARKALLPDHEVHRLQLERDHLRDQQRNLQNSRSLLAEQLSGLQAKESDQLQEALEGELKDTTHSLSDLRARCESLRRILKNEEDRQTEIKTIKSRMNEMEKGTRRWKLLKELIGDATGKKFNDFAQDLSLTQLLALANRRLKDLSDRYVLDKPQEDEDDGLIAIDAHMGGQRRSVKTLSGGETFVLSLAMALALSDLASRNVEIDSLFIDEGFGTLDPEMLDQTLDTLERLQAESSKTIGIISHVESLKERIATQVKLERNGQGYSQLSITP